MLGGRIRYWRRATLLAPAIVLLVAACQAAAPTVSQPSSTAATSAPTAAGPSVAASAASRPNVGASPAAAASPAVAAASPAPAITTPPATAAQSETLVTAVRSVSKQVRPAVVQITNQQQVQTSQFNQPFIVPAGVGSGIIYDAQGHILTNNHVVEGAQQLLVSLPDKRSFPAKLIGADPQTDLAVVQIQGDNLPVAALGDSSQLQVGDWVVAIGNALALPGGPTVTQGVVSALGRTVQEPGGQPGGQSGGNPPTPGSATPSPTNQSAGPFLFDVVQTDAPINPGNSGGPLVDLHGGVIGINTLVAGQAEPGVQAQGIGFAISIATAKPIADQLVQTGKVVHPFLGIQYVPLNPPLAARLGVQVKDGIVIGQVVPGSPAADAGLRPEDIVTAIDNQPLQGESALAEIANRHKPGDTLTLSVLRKQQQLSVTVTLGELPPS
ncbi:MAG: trypsin-like peptidase domain-containing protein [Chloroflexota bacterium]|nr:trypsin-like peptidase domain-containing protein [Chloroflexota bacterium]